MNGTVGTLTGLIPIALAGGLVLGFTQESMKIPGRLQAQEETYRPSRKRKVKKQDIWQQLFGTPGQY